MSFELERDGFQLEEQRQRWRFLGVGYVQILSADEEEPADG